MTERRFGPFFGVQFLGALNDNLFKNALVIMIAFKAASEAESGLLINLAAGLFILPFFLFSAVAGQMADKFEKSRIMRIVKGAEIGIMLVGALGFYLNMTSLLFLTLFAMGTHSAFFGPAKYSILPQHLKEHELMAGNALVEMGTFMAILIGTLAGGLVAGSQNAHMIAAGIVGVAVVGFLVVRFVPEAPATAPNLKLNWNPFTETLALTRLIKKPEAIFNSVLGISWFWYFGATLLAQLPSFTKFFLQGNETVVTLLLAVFSIAIGIGSLLCEKMSGGEIELGLVPIGALGMTLFVGDLFFVNYPVAGAGFVGVTQFLAGDRLPSSLRVMADLALIGIFSSLFIVPLYALIQARADPETRSRVIAANNIFNAVFMVGSALITMALVKIGFHTTDLFLFLAILNFVVSCYIFLLIPEFFMRFCIYVLAKTIYRMRIHGQDHIPRHGGAVIVANHVSWIDWFIVTAACRRPVRFVMDHHIFKNPAVGWLFRLAKAIPIAPAKEDLALKEKAFERLAFELNDGNLVCIFPEGAISRDGEMHDFRAGVERILQNNPVPVIPLAIGGLWGSFFSRKTGGKAMQGLPHPSRRIITVEVGQPMPAGATAKELEDQVRTLLGDQASPASVAMRARSAK